MNTLLAGIIVALISSNPLLFKTTNASPTSEPGSRVEAKRKIQHPVDVDTLSAAYEKTPNDQLLELLIEAATRPLIGLESVDSTRSLIEHELQTSSLTREKLRNINLQHSTVLSARRSLAYYINREPRISEYVFERLKSFKSDERRVLWDLRQTN